MDVCHIDEAGFALTLPTTTTWGAVGCPRYVPFEARQNRRLNVLGAYFPYGPQAGEFCFATFAKVPLPALRADGTYARPLAEVAAQHGLTEDDLGTIDGDAFTGFLWHVAGRPLEAPADWQRERPLYVVVDNYRIHKGERVKLEEPALARANVHLVYLPPYSPELSRMEPHWKIIKHYEVPQRSFKTMGELKEAVLTGLARRALAVREALHGLAKSLPMAP